MKTQTEYFIEIMEAVETITQHDLFDYTYDRDRDTLSQVFEQYEKTEDVENNRLYQDFDKVYAQLGYNLELEHELTQAGINSTSDLIDEFVHYILYKYNDTPKDMLSLFKRFADIIEDNISVLKHYNDKIKYNEETDTFEFDDEVNHQVVLSHVTELNTCIHTACELCILTPHLINHYLENEINYTRDRLMDLEENLFYEK